VIKLHYITRDESGTTSIQKLREYSGHTMSVTAVASRGARMVSGGRDQTTRLWDLETGKQLGMRKIDRNVVTWLEFKDDNTFL
jgi:WD40 repeat protein